jgi:L-gulonate 3-dehydrogenase
MKTVDDIRTIAIIGAGLIGISWATLFAAAGKSVAIYDADEGQRRTAIDRMKANLAMLRDAALMDPDGKHGTVWVCDSLEQAVGNADYVQESVLETVTAKQEVSRAIDKAIGPNTLVGSSSSGIPASAFTVELNNRDRFYIVHPVNPPHLIPVVEIVPAPWSDAAHVPLLRVLMERIGQEPVTVNREIEGFILNRLQGALLNEAFALYAEGFASAEDIDRTVRAGLGLRWSLMGPFETIDLNAPGGIVDYAQRLEPLYHRLALSRTHPVRWPLGAIAQAKSELAATRGDHDRATQIRKRDQWLLELKKAKSSRANPLPTQEGDAL